jgi:hypothetical protein
MVGGVLHDVVHQRTNAQRERQVHGGGHKRLGLGPGRLVVMPADLDMGVVHIHHEADHGAPEQEGHHHTRWPAAARRIARWPAANARHGAAHSSRKCRHQQVVQHKHLAARRHVVTAGKEHALPPDLHHVVQARAPSRCGRGGCSRRWLWRQRAGTRLRVSGAQTKSVPLRLV